MKFFNLLKKELTEIFNLQTILSMFLPVVLLLVMGSFMGDIFEESFNSKNITICDRDNTEFSASVIQKLTDEGHNVKKIASESDDYPSILSENNITDLIVIPKGFSDAVLKSKKADLIIINSIKSMGMTSMMSSDKLGDAVDIIKDAISNTVASAKMISDKDIEFLNNPVTEKNITIVKDKSAEVSASSLSLISFSQSVFVPIIIFILIVMASQTILTAMATEKADKTLETLMSTPVSRLSIIIAKMTSALVIAVVNAVVYMLAFSGFMGSITMGAVSGASNGALNNINEMPDITEVSEALSALGLTLSAGNYIILGINMFLSIAIGISLSLMLGSMSNDLKTAGIMLMPIMFAAMIPYFISIFSSINTLPVVLKIILYIIPFTHTYTAMENMVFGNTLIVWGGLIYQVIFLIGCLYLTIKLFKSDKLFTSSFNIGKKMKLPLSKNK